MTPPTVDDEELYEFKQNLKTWIAQRGMSQRELSNTLGVSYGTVRNWFSSDANISPANMARINELMANPNLYMPRSATLPTVALGSRRIEPGGGNPMLWKLAAQCTDLNLATSLENSDEDRIRFARWATPVIINAIKSELKAHNVAEVKAAALEQIRISKNGYGLPESYDEETIVFHLPVIESRINEFYLQLAAQLAKLDVDNFIAKALDDAASSAFEDDLVEFLGQEEIPIGNIRVPDRDMPF